MRCRWNRRVCWKRCIRCRGGMRWQRREWCVCSRRGVCWQWRERRICSRRCMCWQWGEWSICSRRGVRWQWSERCVRCRRGVRWQWGEWSICSRRRVRRQGSIGSAGETAYRHECENDEYERSAQRRALHEEAPPWTGCESPNTLPSLAGHSGAQMRPVTPPKSNLEERPASSYVFGYTFVSLNGCHRQGAIRAWFIGAQILL